MLFYKATVETSHDILFFNRPLPPDDADLILYVEDQIEELLFADETLADIVYRIAGNRDELLIAVARTKTLGQKPLPADRLCYRVPAAVDLWLKARHVLQPTMPSFVYAPAGYLLLADADTLHRVYRLKSGADSWQEIVTIIDRLRERQVSADVVQYMLYSGEPLPEPFVGELRKRSIEVLPIAFSSNAGADNEAMAHWDFRLQSEIESQELGCHKNRVLRTGIVTGAAIAAVWLLLFGAASLLDRSAKASAAQWKALSPSLKEITYLQRETRSLVSEIKLCRKLSERRTDRASILDIVATTRPSDVFLDELRIDARKLRSEKVPLDRLTINGFSADGKGMAEWMERLLKNNKFSSVNLTFMEKKDAVYRFQIECLLTAAR